MNVYDMEVYAEVRLEQAREGAAIRRLLRAARADTEQPPMWPRLLRFDGRGATRRKARLAEAS